MCSPRPPALAQHSRLAEPDRQGDFVRGSASAQPLSRIAQLDQRTALPDQCLHSAGADVRPSRRKSGFDTLNGHVTLVWAL